VVVLLFGTTYVTTAIRVFGERVVVLYFPVWIVSGGGDRGGGGGGGGCRSDVRCG